MFRARSLCNLIVALLLALPAMAQTVTMTASHIMSGDLSQLLPAGTICFTPTGIPGKGFQVGSTGQATGQPACRDIANGVITTMRNGVVIGPLELADTSLSTPANLGYVTTIRDANGNIVLGGAAPYSGYGNVQPAANNSWCTSGTCNFDAYTPDIAALPLGPSLPELTVGDLYVTTCYGCSAGLPSGSGNEILATPADGSSGTAGLRAMVVNDVPALPESKTTNLVSDLAARGVLSANNAWTGTQAGPFLDKGGALFNIKAYGAVADAVADPNCSMDGSTANLTCPDAPFTACPSGKVVSVTGALTGPLNLEGTVSSCNSSTVAVLSTASTAATGTTTARWGTDNLPALNTAAAAAAGTGLPVVIPGGAYLALIGPSSNITVASNMAYVMQPGGTLYLAGVPGTPSGDSGLELFDIPESTTNVTFTGWNLVGECTGALPALNQSAWVYGYGTSSTSITHITFTGNQTSDLCGFSVHNPDTGLYWNYVGNTENSNGKGVNINADWSNQSGNIFNNSPMEASGAFSQYNYNLFNGTPSQYALQTGGRTLPGYPCNGVSVIGNTVYMSSGSTGGISGGDCIQNSEFASNKIYGLSGSQIGFAFSYQGYNVITGNDVHDNQCLQGTGTSCIYTNGSGTTNNKFHDNKSAGATYGGEFAGAGPEFLNHNWWSGTSYDLYLAEPNIHTQHDKLLGTGTYHLAGSGAIAADAVFDTSSGPNIPSGSSYNVNGVPLVSFNQQAPPWAQFLGDGSGGASTCGGNLSGEHWYTNFTVTGTCTVNSQVGLVIRATGTCTITGTITATGASAGINSAPVGGGSGGGSGGGTAAGTAASNLSMNGISTVGGGSAGGASGGNGGNGNTPSAQAQLPFVATPPVLIGVGGGQGKAGGSTGGSAGNGGAGVFLICNTISGSGGTINVSGQAGGNAAANNTGAGSAGGGGVIIISAHTHSTDPTMTVSGGTGGSCLTFTGCGTGGSGGSGWSKSLTF